MTARSASPPLLGAEGLACGRRREVLRDVTLQVHSGEAWFVVGRNGSGKSTLLDALLGLLPPRAGRVLPVCGGDRRALGLVPQQSPYAAALPCTAAEFVASGLDATLSRAQRAVRVAAALAAVEAPELERSDVRTLSIGQRRRVVLARALVREPRLLVLDEPTASLDAPAAMRLAVLLERLRCERALATIHVSHDLRLAQRFATHLAFVAEGQVFAGVADEVLRHPGVINFVQEAVA